MSIMSSVIHVKDIVTRFGEQVVHNGVSFDVHRGTVSALIGGSGTGKSTVLKEILGLLCPAGGNIELFGVDVWHAGEDEREHLRERYGVLFQGGALFSGLSVGENVAAPLVERTRLPKKVVEELVKLRLALTGLAAETCEKMPSELSGGMVKRVALARAMAQEPDVLFLDEPTSGLDPVNARAFDALIRTLADSLGLTVLMVTHDLDSIEAIADQVIVLADGKVIADGSYEEVKQNKHPWINEYFTSRKQ